ALVRIDPGSRRPVNLALLDDDPFLHLGRRRRLLPRLRADGATDDPADRAADQRLGRTVAVMMPVMPGQGGRRLENGEAHASRRCESADPRPPVAPVHAPPSSPAGLP